MAEGDSKKRTARTARYQKKVGLISKSYKLRQTDVEAFAEACKARDESQAAVLTRLMREYIAETN